MDLRNQLSQAIDRVLDSGWFVLGPENEALEAELSQFLDVEHCALVANGTDALRLALLALDVRPGDLVLTAANAGGYTSTAARSIGAVPAYADVDPETHLLVPDTLDAALRTTDRKPAVLVVTHLFGKLCHMAALLEWAGRHGIAVIEDCAQSLGAEWEGQMGGGFASLATTSFYPSKNLGALGDGGAVFGADASLIDRVRKLRQYGWGSKYRVALESGFNSRMDEMQAAVVRVKLPFLQGWNERRREIHRRYQGAAGPGVRVVHDAAGGDFVAHLAVVETDDRAAVAAAFERAGIRTDVHYPVPDHRQPAVVRSAPQLPVTESMADRVLSLPMFPELTADEVGRVETVLRGLR